MPSRIPGSRSGSSAESRRPQCDARLGSRGAHAHSPRVRTKADPDTERSEVRYSRVRLQASTDPEDTWQIQKTAAGLMPHRRQRSRRLRRAPAHLRLRHGRDGVRAAVPALAGRHHGRRSPTRARRHWKSSPAPHWKSASTGCRADSRSTSTFRWSCWSTCRICRCRRSSW